MSQSESAPPRPSKRPRADHEAPPVVPLLPDEVIVEHILTRVPAAATVRFRAVCREWRAALTSDHFVQAYQAAAAGQPPEIVFFVPGAGAGSTSFYSSRLNLRSQQNVSSPPDDAHAPARELVTVGNLRAKDLVLSGTKPCDGLTLLFQPGESAYHVFNLSTGEHVSLPPCPWAFRVLPYGPYVLSSAGIGFHPGANEHVVVRLFEDWSRQQRCEVYGLRSGGWRPFAGRVPPHAANGLNGHPPVLVDGCFYWHMNTRTNFAGPEQNLFPEPILSLSVDTEQFGWVRPPEERARYCIRLAELGGHLCVVVDNRLGGEWYELWVRSRTAAPSWSLRCRIGLASLPRPMRVAMSLGNRMLPLGSSGGKILLGTSRHEVFAYDPERNGVERVFSVLDFMDAPREPELFLNIAVHEETVAGVRRRGDVGKLEVKLGRGTVASRRGGPAAADQQRRDDLIVTQQQAQRVFSAARALFRNIANMRNLSDI